MRNHVGPLAPEASLGAMFGVALLLPCLLIASGCSTRTEAPAPQMLLGSFEDDYDLAYTISTRTWKQRPGGLYHIARWRGSPSGGYLIAQNDSSNAADGGRWTRIDWVALPDMAPYEWAFCLSTYDAPTAAAAESSRVARPEAPRTGCNGFPFSRMRRVSSG
ncbi:MAG: hypothetical protein AAFQ43_00770 [Bacteroidota bacterium]